MHKNDTVILRVVDGGRLREYHGVYELTFDENMDKLRVRKIPLKNIWR